MSTYSLTNKTHPNSFEGTKLTMSGVRVDSLVPRSLIESVNFTRSVDTVRVDVASNAKNALEIYDEDHIK